MVDAIDVAEYILEKVGPMTTMKLQKLVYYSQAWHLAWTENSLFNDKIEAWRNGPVVPGLYELHKKSFKIEAGFFFSQFPNRTSQLTENHKDIIDRIILYYAERDPHWLSQLTHMEDPWKNARSRSKASDEERSSEEITHQSMFEYYSAL